MEGTQRVDKAIIRVTVEGAGDKGALVTLEFTDEKGVALATIMERLKNGQVLYVPTAGVDLQWVTVGPGFNKRKGGDEGGRRGKRADG